MLSEYVDLAHAFVDREETGMAYNAVLDQIARRLCAGELEKA
jgi:N utilization substance protein B